MGQIGRAEVENELQKTATKITDEKKHLMTETQQPVELDGMELKKYIELVVREVKKDNSDVLRVLLCIGILGVFDNRILEDALKKRMAKPHFRNIYITLNYAKASYFVRP
ncbi:MAG: hypothetical protein WA364_03930 [Candidatus Nitrosopolaris sp.]